MPKKARDLIFSIVAIPLGLALAYTGGKTVLDSRNSDKWPTVTGEIGSSKVMETTRTKKGKEVGRTYEAEVDYNYNVDGIRYTNSKISFGGSTYEEPDEAVNMGDKYAEGKEVEIYYKPSDPSTAVLEPGFHKFDLWVPGIGLAAFIIGCLTLRGSIMNR